MGGARAMQICQMARQWTERFFGANQSGQWPGQAAKAASSLLYEGNRKDADKEANGCFPQDNGRERKGFQKDQSQGTGSKTAYFWEQIHKTTRLVAF